MKKTDLVLSMLLIYSILCIEKKDFDLSNGIKYRYNSFEKDGVYKFYIKANFAQNVTFAFHTEMITKSPFSYIFINEYSNRYDEITNNRKNLSIINIKGGYTDSVTFASYIVNSPNTNYIAFEVSPNQQIKYTSMARIDVIDGVYDLSNRESKKINNIKSGGIYIFYVPVKEEQKVNINLTTNYINNNPFNKLEISEYLLRENNFNDKITKSQSISKTTKTSNNELISSFTYTVLPDKYSSLYHNYNVANYIALKIIPSNITYLIVQFDVLVSSQNLNNREITLTNLKADETYIFYININKCQRANLSMEINSMNEKPFNYVNIYEYADNSYAYEEKENQTISFSRKENNLITSFSYILKSKYKQTNCIYINIKPLLDIKSLKIKSDIIGGLFQLSTKEPKRIANLIKGGPYYFLIKAEKFQKITFNVNMDNINTIPFEIVVFTEYDYRGIKGSNPIKTTEKKISFSSSNNQLISNFSHIVSKYWTRETVLNIIPNANINYMNIKFEVENTYYELYYEEQKIYNLTVGNKYYLHKHVYGQGINKIYLDLMMDYIDINPFGPIKVYEYEWTFEYDNKDESIINNLNITTKKKNESLIVSSSYRTIKERSSGVVFEISPNYNINCLKIKYEGKFENETKKQDEENEKQEEKKRENDSKNSHNFYISISIGLASLILITIIICIIKRINKSKIQNLYFSSLDGQQQNLVPRENY